MSYAAVRSTNTLPAFFLAKKLYSISWVKKVTYPQYIFYVENQPACGAAESQLLVRLEH